MKRNLIIAAAILAVLLIAVGSAAGIVHSVKSSPPPELAEQRAIYLQQPPPGGTVYRDVLYQRRLFNSQALDIYMPDEGMEKPERGYPAIVFVHGGSWMHGDKEDIRVVGRFLEKMRAEGWAVISINYVTSPLRMLEGPSDNVSRAFNWIHEHADEYGIDPWNMGVYSVSAGSHLTMEAMNRSGDPGSLWRFWLEEIGPVDLLAMADGEAYDASSTLSRFPRRYLRKHSPILYVNGPFPPTTIVHGDADHTVDIAQSERLMKVLREHGTTVTMKVVPGGNHGFFNMDQSVWENLEDMSITFMKRYFRK